jgi:hypothetical protein
VTARDRILAALERLGPDEGEVLALVAERRPGKRRRINSQTPSFNEAWSDTASTD